MYAHPVKRFVDPKRSQHRTLTWLIVHPTHYTTANSGWYGNVTFTYNVTDGKTTDTGTVTLVVPPPVRALVARDGFYGNTSFVYSELLHGVVSMA